MRTKRTVLAFFFFIPTLAFSSSFHFPTLSLRNITLLGDSHLKSGILGLTRDLPVPASSSGSALYNKPITLFNSQSNTTASFSTKFTFSITNLNPASFGDGLAFFISPNNDTIGSPGGYLGLVNSSDLSKNRFVAVEFDTRQDFHFGDPNENHVGLDVDSLSSVAMADPMVVGVDLKSGNWITAWIDYRSEEKLVRVFLSYSSFRPERPVLSVEVDLGVYFREFEVFYVGFSGSTEGSTESHVVENWSFEVSEIGMKGRFGDGTRSRLNPHNVSGDTVFVKPERGEPRVGVEGSEEGGNKGHRKVGLGLGIAGPAFFFVVLVVFGYVSFRKWQDVRFEKNLKAELLAGPREFSYKELKTATRGFHAGRILGHGAFGTVYKAFLASSGTIAAIKRSKHSHEGKTEFLAELSIIACLRHKNLVQLQGWCVEKGELLLVYDFMSNGSLDGVLYRDSEYGSSLKWPQRYNIAVGLASVLTYLHEECEQQVIHRDIKTSNVMLDGNFNARLGDFGLARLMDHDKSPVSTLTAGTMGYLAPEYLQYGKATEKTDVFSYGVVVLELACGRRPIEREPNGHTMVNLVDWVWKLHSEGKIIEAADKRLKGDFDREEIKKLLLIGLSCANPDSTVRPSMRRVLQVLNSEAELVAVPKLKPSLSFSCSLPLSLEDIMSGGDECNSPSKLV